MIIICFILNNYVIEKECSEFNGEWNPDDIKSKEDLKLEIEKCGNNFWGDHILLQLLQKALNINVIILKSDNYCNSINDDDRFVIHSLCDILHQDRKTIIIYYFEEFHFQLVGYFDGNIMKTLFSYDEIPPDVMSIYNLDTARYKKLISYIEFLILCEILVTLSLSNENKLSPYVHNKLLSYCVEFHLKIHNTLRRKKNFIFLKGKTFFLNVI